MRTELQALKQRSDPKTWPYLAALGGGAMTLEQFIRSQQQFRYAVEYFAEPMRALSERVENPARAVLLGNIEDERGGGDPSRAHGATFDRLLAGLGATHRETAGAAVTAFNSELITVCRERSPLEGLAMLGMIEDLFSGISGLIGRAIADQWLPADQVEHYAVHEALDVEHAEGFYRLVEARFAEGPAVRAGLERGARAFEALYAGLWAV